jgi:hypothetical protein
MHEIAKRGVGGGELEIFRQERRRQQRVLHRSLIGKNGGRSRARSQ